MIDAKTTMARGRGRTIVGGLVLIALLAACDWSQFGYSASHTNYNPTESAIGVGNVGQLTTQWTATVGGGFTSSPALSNRTLYIHSAAGALYATSADGSTNCSGTPTMCAPLWTTAPDGSGGQEPISSPAVANGVVYTGSSHFLDGSLKTFSAAGTTNCSGNPKTCAPLWTAPTGGSDVGSPTLANGTVYVVASDSRLYAFDAAGTTNCSGTPKTCAPLWTAPTDGGISSPTVSDGVVYVASPGVLRAFDAAGKTGCSGTPKTCAPLWTAPTDGGISSPAVANGFVYVSSYDSLGLGTLRAFSASGTANCSGTPKTCSPIWTATASSSRDGWAPLSSPAVANGVVYVGASGDASLYAFDAAGKTGCSGIPKTCAPVWTAPTGGLLVGSPTVANGVVYVAANDYSAGWLRAFDAAGARNCSATPKTCAPLWSTTFTSVVSSSVVVANGAVYLGSVDGTLHAFGLPKR